jgi:hypothetical protein
MRMMPPKLTALLAVVFLAAPVLAQDSTAIDTPPNGLPGDAVSPWVPPSEQLNTYIVDMDTYSSTWDNDFAIAPLVKTSKTSRPGGSINQEEFFNSLFSAQSVSNHLMQNQDFAFDSYDFWNDAGYGINDDPAINDLGTAVSTTGKSGFQFSALISEYATTDADTPQSYNGVIGAVVNYEASNPMRLYVARIMAAVNSANDTENRSQFGVGSVDDHGNAYYRGDGFGSTGPNILTGQNYFRTRLLSRNPAVMNIIDNAGASMDATDWLIQDPLTDTYNTPNNIPQFFAGAPGIVAGSNFRNEYVRGTGAPLTADTTHRCRAVNHRGSVGYTQYNFPDLFGPGTVNGTAGMLLKDVDNVATRTINVWGLDVNGDPVNPICLDLPVMVTDNDDGWTNNILGNPQLNEFNHYVSQTAARGGNSPVALGRDQEGRLIAAAEVDMPSPLYTNPANFIAVCRATGDGNDATLGTTLEEWTMACWCDGSNPSKAIKDGSDGNTIGNIYPLYIVTSGSVIGPSMSAPMIDSVGNVYFLAGAGIPKGEPPTIDYDTMLFRAVYDPVGKAPNFLFRYQLEMLVEVGDVFHGQNSNRNYQLQFMEIADSNSVSSATTWSSNIIQQAFLGQDPSDLATDDMATLGGLVFAGQIVYDVNQDGNFERVTGTTGNPLSPDQQYSVLMYIQPVKTGCACSCIGDIAQLDGTGCDNSRNVTDFTRLASSLYAFVGDANYNICADLNGDGVVNVTDFTLFSTKYNVPCP